jgi:hypothetical protein
MAMGFNQIKALYHFTDRRNLPLIKKHGGLLSRQTLEANGIEVPAPGGNDWSQDADDRFGVHRYVHLCFRKQHPMEFLAKKAGRLKETIFLEIDPKVLYLPDVKFTEDVSNKSGITPILLVDAERHVDFEVICAYTDWNNADIKARLKKVSKCEILVPDSVPLKYIRNLPNG